MNSVVADIRRKALTCTVFRRQSMVLPAGGGEAGVPPTAAQSTAPSGGAPEEAICEVKGVPSAVTSKILL